MTVTGETCPYPWSWAVVTSNGDVRPCCYGEVIGSLEAASFEEIWNARPILELRHAVRTGQLHSVCRGAACTYAVTKRSLPQVPGLTDHRYAFHDIAVSTGAAGTVITGRVENAGDQAWPTLDRNGAPKVLVGARLFAADGTTLAEARSAIPAEFMFPREILSFQLTLPATAGARIVLDLVKEAEYWFVEKGCAGLVLTCP